MKTELTKTQIDRLGDCLRKDVCEADLKILDSYRKSFGSVYGNVIKVLQGNLKLEPTGRPAKSTTSIVDKLHRESIRLSQLQDIAGCRIVVKNIQEQDYVVSLIRDAFPSVVLVDRRIKPNFGYRAVHLIVKSEGKLVEIQVRTTLQHEWADLSEKFSDKIDPSIKCGGGSKIIQERLLRLSQHFEGYEKAGDELVSATQDITDELQKVTLKNLRDRMDKLMIGLIKEFKKKENL